jgi:hypothetical protein
MRRTIAALLVLVWALAVVAVPAEADSRRHFHGVRTRVFVGVGPTFWWGPGPYWYYPPPYYVYSPPPVVVQEPPVYIQQVPPPPPPPPPPAPQAYWYYCPSARGYYPSVPSCPEPWVPVPPRTE